MSIVSKKPFTLDRIVRIIIGLLILVGAGLLVNRLSGVLLPFLIAWLIAYLMYPLLSFFQYKLKFKSRILAIAASLFSILGVLTLGGYLLFPPILAESQKAGVIINNFLTDPQIGWNIPPALAETIQNFLKSIEIQNHLNFENMEGLAQSLLTKMWDFVSGAGGMILNVLLVFLVLLYLIFILKDYEKISTGWIRLIPKHYRHFVLHVGEDLKKGMNRYFRGQSLIALTVAILSSIGFSIIGLPLSIVFGIFVGFLTMVPYLKTIALIPGIMLAAIKAAEYNENFFWVVVSVLAVFGTIQLIEDLFLVPKIMGNATGLHPAIIVLSLSIWGSLFGVIGMILALPMTTLITSYYERFVIAGDDFEGLVSTQKLPEEKSTNETELVDNDATQDC
jgi:predicted PurR-regulated permease PerM